jgi:hypothetical protein
MFANTTEALGAIHSIKSQMQHSKLQPPAPWQPHFSEKYNRVYYYNTETSESIWDLPDVEQSGSFNEEVLGAGPDSIVNSDRHGHSAPPNEVVASSVASPEASIDASTASSRGTRIEDQLLKRGEEYARHREQLRLQREAEYRAEFSGTPKVTPLAQQKPQSELSIGDRASILLQKKKEKEERLRQELETETAKEIKAAPVISKKSKSLQRSVTDMLAWEQDRKARVEAMKVEAQKAREAEVTSNPVVASRAVNERLLQRRKGKEITSEGATVSIIIISHIMT